MIRIQRMSRPEKLTDELMQELTEEYKRDNKKCVWNKPYIRSRLLEMSHNKCSYCECLIGAGNKEMHVDHFKPKKSYPDLVVEWCNLLPSCPHCNKNKGCHDTGKEPIINPTEDDPRKYLYLKLYRYHSKQISYNSIGNATIDILNLNDSSCNVIERFKIGDAIQIKIREIFDYFQECPGELTTNTRKRNKIYKTCRDILTQGLETEPFSALIATIIHNDENYILFKKLLIENGLWDSELQALHDNSLKNKYDICIK